MARSVTASMAALGLALELAACRAATPTVQVHGSETWSARGTAPSQGPAASPGGPATSQGQTTPAGASTAPAVATGGDRRAEVTGIGLIVAAFAGLFATVAAIDRRAAVRRRTVAAAPTGTADRVE